MCLETKAINVLLQSSAVELRAGIYCNDNVISVIKPCFITWDFTCNCTLVSISARNRA